MEKNLPPVVLSLSALDPSGCGGIQADIETAASLGCHCAPVASALCTTGITETAESLGVDATIVIEQARSVLEDMQVAAIKIGFIGSVENVEAMHTILQDYPHLPVVLSPSFCLWDRAVAEQAELPSALNELLLPLSACVVLTYEEAKLLSETGDSPDATARALLNKGSASLMMIDKNNHDHSFFVNLYDQKGLMQRYEWQKKSPTCHGTSSTLASAMASYLAHGCPLHSAAEQAQNFTWQAMSAARQLGFGKPTPHRFFWADENIEKPEAMPSGNPNN